MLYLLLCYIYFKIVIDKIHKVLYNIIKLRENNKGGKYNEEI